MGVGRIHLHDETGRGEGVGGCVDTRGSIVALDSPRA
jgi:hypothetical protein